MREVKRRKQIKSKPGKGMKQREGSRRRGHGGGTEKGDGGKREVRQRDKGMESGVGGGV